MDKILEIKRQLQNITQTTQAVLITGTVTALQKETCTVKLDTGIELTDVRLKVGYTNAENYAISYPKIGTRAAAVSLSGSLSDLMIIKADEVSKWEIKQGDLSFMIDDSDNKFQIKNGETSLVDLFQTLTDIVKSLRVYTGTGASGKPIATIQERLNSFETDFKKLLK